MGLTIDESVTLEITISDLSALPMQILHIVEDKVITWAEDRALEVARAIAKEAKKIADEAVKDGKAIANEAEKDGKAVAKEAEKLADETANTFTQGYNATEHEIAHGLYEMGHDASTIANTLKDNLGLGLQETAAVLSNLSILSPSALGSTLSATFGTSQFEAAGALIGTGAMSVDHALASQIGDPAMQTFQAFGSDVVTAANDIANAGVQSWNAIEDVGEKVGGGIVDTGKTIGDGIVDTGKKVGDGIVDTGKKVGDGFVIAEKTVERGVVSGWSSVGSALGLW
jgi:hypothetical protein